MRIISKIKDVYYNLKLKKAKRYFSDGSIEQSVNILEDILDCHLEAPSILLSVYLSDILSGSDKRISDVALLYEKHQSLKGECIGFANRLAVIGQIRLFINYCQALYSKGIDELMNQFVASAMKFVIEESNHIDSLLTLTNNTSLLRSLSESILVEAQASYTQSKDLKKSERLCLLIKPYLSSQEFYGLYSNVRFDLIVQDDITEESARKLNVLFDDIKTTYRLSDNTVESFVQKSLNLARRLFEQKNYFIALFVSRRFIENNPQARKIYADSALNMYIVSDSRVGAIESEILYKCLGEEDSVLVNSLEPFIPYSTHRQKYIAVVISELTELVAARTRQQKQKQAAQLFNRAWDLTSDVSLIKEVLSIGSSDSRIYFASLIIKSDKNFISNSSNLQCFLDGLSKLDNVEFVVTALENLLDNGRDVKFDYEIQIYRLAKAAKDRSRKRVEIIERGLAKIQTQGLYETEASYLDDYIDGGSYDLRFAKRISSSLIGHIDSAEILISKILIDEADESQDFAIRENCLREALSLMKEHSKLFNSLACKSLLKQIEGKITQLVLDLYTKRQYIAIELLYLLRDNNLSWFDTYASLYLDFIQNEEGTEEIASKIIDIITEGAGVASKLVDDKLWSKYVSVKRFVVSSKNNDNIDDAILEFENLYSVLDTLCRSENKEELKKDVSSILVSMLLLRAKNYEKGKVYDKAIGDYNRIVNLSEAYPAIKARIFICKLKDGQSFSNTDKAEIDDLLSEKKNSKYQQDLAYRWCIYLMSLGQLEKAEDINERILGTDSEIAQICNEERINAQQCILDELNEQIRKLNDSELTAEEAIAFGKSLSIRLKDISLIVNVTTQKSSVLKETIRIYAIEEFYKQGDYIQSFNGLKIYDSSYLSDPIALRNMAIMSLNAAENGLLTETNYKELLAIWATAIYQQKIFVDSLNYTSWDNPYTFTLESALGKLDNNVELPNNVNYDNPSENRVISILEVQKALLSRMEVAIQDNCEYQQFLLSQLEAMDKLAEQNLDESCELVAPYMLEISNVYKKNMSKALEIEVEKHYENWEAILEIGHLYGLNNGDFNKYALALDALNTAITSIERKQKIDIISSFSTSQISRIKEFDGLKNKLISSVATVINNDISQNIEYIKFYYEYGVAVKNIGDDTLAFMFSNYINQQVVKALNNKTQTLAKGASILFEIYDFCKCNPHVKRNLENIVEALIHNYISEGDEGNLTVLNNALTVTREFDPAVVKSLKGDGDVPEEMLVLLFSSNESRFNMLKAKIGGKSSIIQNQFTATATKMSVIKVQMELSKIVEQVNNNTINKCDALQKVYNIYKNNKNNDSVCKNLATLIPMCIMEYVIPDKYGRSKVEAVLDSLKLNVSVTFRIHNSEIGDAYTMIWNQLPFNARIAIESNPGVLNEQGQSLKKGLDYLKALR